MVPFRNRKLNRRSEQFQKAMMRKNSVILKRLANNRNEEIAYGRFLRNQQVTHSKLFAAAIARTNQASAGRHLLLIEDTSSLAFGLTPKAGILGPIAGGKGQQGLYVHPVIALDADQGACTGLGAAQFLQREHLAADDPRQDKAYRKRERSQKSFAEKESYRWWQAAKQAVDQTPLARQHTVIADSEADIYDLMFLLEQHSIDFVLRSFENRTVNYPRSGLNLVELLAQKEIRSTYEVNLPATDKRSAHQATLQLKWERICLAKPKNSPNKELPATIEVTVVEVIEHPDTVVGKEKPIHWRLFTSHPVTNEQQAHQIIRWYTWRWMIEQVFRTLKTKGLDIETAQVESPHSLYNLIALSLISAVRVMQLVQARDGNNDLTIEQVFDPEEVETIQKLNQAVQGRTQKLKNPHSPESLAFAAWVVGRLGGWSGYESQKPPGPITMLRGLQRLNDILFGQRLLNQLE